jgi:hypothetical protein
MMGNTLQAMNGGRRREDRSATPEQCRSRCDPLPSILSVPRA